MKFCLLEVTCSSFKIYRHDDYLRNSCITFHNRLFLLIINGSSFNYWHWTVHIGVARISQRGPATRKVSQILCKHEHSTQPLYVFTWNSSSFFIQRQQSGIPVLIHSVFLVICSFTRDVTCLLVSQRIPKINSTKTSSKNNSRTFAGVPKELLKYNFKQSVRNFPAKWSRVSVEIFSVFNSSFSSKYDGIYNL